MLNIKKIIVDTIPRVVATNAMPISNGLSVRTSGLGVSLGTYPPEHMF